MTVRAVMENDIYNRQIYFRLYVIHMCLDLLASSICCRLHHHSLPSADIRCASNVATKTVSTVARPCHPPSDEGIIEMRRRQKEGVELLARVWAEYRMADRSPLSVVMMRGSEKTKPRLIS